MEVLQIAVCEDERRDIDVLKSLIKQSGVAAKVFEYTVAEALLSDFVPGIFHVVLLDIYLDGKDGANGAPMSGFEAAERIREVDGECWIAFTTVSRDHVHLGYKVKADRYLEKPLDEQEVLSLLQRAKEFFEGREKVITLMVDRKLRTVKMKDIMCIEKYRRKSILHMTDETLDVYVTMDELLDMLTFPPFLQCHRSYIVNMDYVDFVDGEFVIPGGIRASISMDAKRKTLEKHRAYKTMLAKGERW